MSRKTVYDVISEEYDCYEMGIHYEHSESPYVVYKTDGQTSGKGYTDSILGGYENYIVMCYCPPTTFTICDTMIDTLKELFKKHDLIEYMGRISGDIYDSVIDMNYRYFDIRIPREV